MYSSQKIKKENWSRLYRLVFSVILFGGAFFIFSPIVAHAYGECSQYGSMSYLDISGYCTCMSGYVFGKDFLGHTSCISVSQACINQYGIMSTEDYLTGNCTCMSGYVFGEDVLGNKTCVSGDQECKSEYGFMSRYNSLSGKCACFSGYVFGTGSNGKTQCIPEDEWCQKEYGYNSNYNNLTDECECNKGYALVGNLCVIQQKICSLNSTLVNGQCMCNIGYMPSGNICITYTQNCQNQYGINSYGDKNNCYCSTGYKWNSLKTSCVNIICPDNSSLSGNRCICDDGYAWDASQTECTKIQQNINTNPSSSKPSLGACSGVTFTRNLTVGSTGSDVKCLQFILNQSVTTRVATTGVGSPGNESTYFGPATLTAVQKYQKVQGWNPGNGVGPNTRALLNAYLNKNQ